MNTIARSTDQVNKKKTPSPPRRHRISIMLSINRKKERISIYCTKVWVDGRNGVWVVELRLVCVLQLLADIVVLQDVDDAEEHDHLL